MRLSTKGRYGARFMLDLALHYGQGPVPLKDVAERQGISEKYLWNLIGPLRTAGLMQSFRGSGGGYAITKPPSDITLKDIVSALEGPLCLVDCVDNPSACERSGICVTRDVWHEVTDKLRQTLESITLKDMIDRWNSRAHSDHH